jgi:hypothetical protein
MSGTPFLLTPQHLLAHIFAETEFSHAVLLVVIFLASILVIIVQVRSRSGKSVVGSSLRQGLKHNSNGSNIIFAKRFASFRIPNDLFTITDSSDAAAGKSPKDNKLVRQAKKLFKFMLPRNAQSVADFSNWGVNSEAFASLLDPNSTPLVCFVNCKSGGKQGEMVMELLREFLGANQVFDLSRVNPTEVLTKFLPIPSLRLLVAGGDGSAGWILKCLEEFPMDSRPPLAVLPLGTGNDLARVLGWGHTLECSELVSFLDHIRYASIATMDRWEVTIERDQDNSRRRKQSVATSSEASSDGGNPQSARRRSKSAISEGTDGGGSTSESPSKASIKGADSAGSTKVSKKFAFNNYFGVGVDASIAHTFHEARNQDPSMFSSQFVNKIWYALIGGGEIIAPTNRNLSDYLTIYADGEEIAIDEGFEGIILSNIPSYGGGAHLWARQQEDEPVAGGLYDTASDEEDDSDATDGLMSPPPPSEFVCTKMGHVTREVIVVYVAGIDYDSTYSSDYLATGRADTEALPKVWKPESFQDGLLEVVSVQGSFHLAQIQVGLASATRLKQAREIVIKIHKNDIFRKFPVQVDGEPWFEQTGCTITVTRSDTAQLLAYTSVGSRYASIATEVIEWGYRNQVLNTKQRKTLLLECSRRLEIRNRHESVSYEDDAVNDVLPML